MLFLFKLFALLNVYARWFYWEDFLEAHATTHARLAPRGGWNVLQMKYNTPYRYAQIVPRNKCGRISG